MNIEEITERMAQLIKLAYLEGKIDGIIGEAKDETNEKN